MNKKIIFVLFILYVIVATMISISPLALAAEPKIVSKLNTAFSNVEDWIIKLSTPAAAVAVGTGIFMKKFSFGDEERLRTGKKLIRSTLFSYAFILAVDLILAAIKSLVS